MSYTVILIINNRSHASLTSHLGGGILEAIDNNGGVVKVAELAVRIASPVELDPAWNDGRGRYAAYAISWSNLQFNNNTVYIFMSCFF